jgi:hypothetical protein
MWAIAFLTQVEPFGQGCTMTHPQDRSLRVGFILAGIHGCFIHGEQFLQRLNLSGKVEHSAGSGRLVRCGGHERWSTYLRNAIILTLHQPHGQNVRHTGFGLPGKYWFIFSLPQRNEVSLFNLHPLPVTYARTSDAGMRTCCMVSRSRTVTVPSSSDWKSTVTQYGVPISSWRR